MALAYGMTSFSSAILNNIFITYYVEMAVSVTRVSEGWFMTAQVIYCIWNSLNDPACGWWGDTHAVKSGKGKLYQRRLPRIKFGGPLWALSFLLMWFPWGDGATSPTLAGIHLVATLILYDGWLSYTLINHQALLADMTGDTIERERCNMYGAGCQILGSGAIFAAHLCWDIHNLHVFRIFAAIAAAISCFGFYSTSNSPHITERAAHQLGASPRCKSDTPTLMAFTKQAAKQKNLWVFIAMGILQQFSCTFSTNFFSMFLVLLVGKHLSNTTQSVVLYASFILPHLGTMVITPILQKVSKKNIIMILFGLRLVTCVAAMKIVCSYMNVSSYSLLSMELLDVKYLDDSSDPHLFDLVSHMTGNLTDRTMNVRPESVNGVYAITYVLTACLLANRVFTETVCRLEPLVITDLIDEDCVVNKRQHLMSSMIFGSFSLFTKPAQSLAPMIGYYFVTRHSASPLRLWLCVTSLTFVIPLIFTTLSMLAWHNYRLTGDYLKFIKSVLVHELPNATDGTYV
eukprot:TRINITY_DN2614_c0_g3_i1.p1 TRINITY_DN2614_c0_g3~~TRINITY_DN2614_c0_g3_i1.p1  ORF type:complete len:548 (+),score=32.13 TRINITY_DN2614_c0_g3_i1:101-1645(+)